MSLRLLHVGGLMRAVVPVVALLGLAEGARAQLIFNFTPAPSGITAQATNGFIAAGNRWSAIFNDNVTINIQIGFSTLGAGILAQAGSTDTTYTYTNVRNALIADATSADDALAVANLPSAPAFNMMLNYTSNNPNGSGSATAYLDNDGDANNTTLRINNANAKALGLLAGNNAAQDAQITFSDAFTWDFDPSNGITAGAFDFVGIAAHEIGHALGFESGVDILDINSTGSFFSDAAFTYVTPLDLYRRSALSLANGGDNTLDWTAGNSNAYFSLDGGTTNLGLFSTGQVHGDGRQASHFKDGLGLGIMDPTAAPGELLNITNLDKRAFDAIGWTITTATAPEPGTLALAFLGVPVLLARRKRS